MNLFSSHQGVAYEEQVGVWRWWHHLGKSNEGSNGNKRIRKGYTERLIVQLCWCCWLFLSEKKRRSPTPSFHLSFTNAKDRSHSLGLSPLLINSHDLEAVARAKHLSQQKDYQNK